MRSFFLRWLNWKADPARPGPSAPPLQAELFSIDQLARHARELAASHQVASGPRANPLLARLHDNELALSAFNRGTVKVNPQRHITPAAEWLLDNFYLIEEQIQLARRHLPRGFSRELPCLAHGPSAGLPRVYDIVLELIAHVDAQIDAEPLRAFAAAYQTVATLKLGELWAVPIMLRLGLIENLRRVTNRLTLARSDRDLADLWVDRLQEVAEKHPAQVVVVVADMAVSDLPMTSSFVAEFCQRLSRQSPVLHLARTWLEQRLAEQGLSTDQLIQIESQNQAADQASVSHSITSLRFLSATDWKHFVESLSLVEAVLRTDPAGVYPAMDFATRDCYRHVIESLARLSGREEGDVANRAVQLAAERAKRFGPQDRSAHVGFHLIDKGRPQLEAAVQVRWPARSLCTRCIRRFPLAFYAGGIGALTLLAGAGYFWFARAPEVSEVKLIGSTLVFALAASQAAVALVNWLTTLLIPPSLLPRVDYSEGLPPDQRTVVVVPTLLTNAAAIEHLVETLEIHHLSNRDPHLHFALLTDFADALEQDRPEDEALLQQARTGVEALNLKYPAGAGSYFYLFHRPRRWNAGEGVWMGYERKRGKLAEFNAWLRGGARDCFSTIVGATGVLSEIKYVITLDTDTQLPRDSARQLVGTMAHPLNRPVFDPIRGIVIEGYGILQPRVGVSLPSARRSRFVRLFAGDAGIDPYTREVSDVYQDLFREGSFIGKGIYEVDAFERALQGRFPANRVLSHDLLEACHARSGLVSDVEFYEEYPSRFNVDAARRHRWIRGDWQIAPWLLPQVPAAGGRISNPLSVLSKWKLFDNLRRSLVPAACLALIVGRWLVWPQPGALGALLVLGIFALPALLAALVNAVRKPEHLPWLMHGRIIVGASGRQLGQILLTLSFLPYDAFANASAIVRTLGRMLITRRRLLEWQTSDASQRARQATLAGFYLAMWFAPGTALAAGIALAVRQPAQLYLAFPLLALWIAAPWTAWWISEPLGPPAPKLSAGQLAFLRATARRTWHYFERFVTEQENWLPPDNFQEMPAEVVASRTSPTNIGIALLANLAAVDLGYLPVGGLIRRTADTFATLDRLKTYRGHFYNWYETRTLEPLLPLYVSTVDSGNLAGHLLTLASGLREQTEQEIFTPQIFAGLLDTLAVLREHAPAEKRMERLASELARSPAMLHQAFALLEQATAESARWAESGAEIPAAAQGWAQTLRRNCEAHRDDLLWLAPWLALPLPDRRDDPVPYPMGVPTLRELAGESPSALPAGGPDTPYSRCRREAAQHARERLVALEALAVKCEQLAAMDFAFLYSPERDLFCTGFNVSDHRRETGCYDLLASEARLGSYVAIALGQVPQDHWFSLGRLLVAPEGEPLLVSWSGSMFEYLMPLLVMPNYENTLLDHTCRAAVRQQIRYGAAREVPWGISESGYNRTDAQLNYQYRAFGVPGLGFKRGLAEDLVIAPYASALALMVAPVAACENLQRLAAEGRAGEYGFYEAVDYTPVRLSPDDTSVTVRSFMVHHQGMSLLALDNLLVDFPMQRRFMACPLLKATDLLLQERMPKAAAGLLDEDLNRFEARTLPGPEERVMRVFTNLQGPVPEVQLLSNGRYHVAVTHTGGGYSRWRDLAVTRWREDTTRDCWGTFIYLREPGTGEVWSAAHQPTLRSAKGDEAIFTQARAEYRQLRRGLEIHTEICVSPEDDVELRRLTITNRNSAARTLELTSYAEVVLAPVGADAAHPAFSNLFVQTEFLPACSALLCTRRPRSAEEKSPWLLHLMVGQGGELGPLSCETDRSRFVGRNGSLANPAALQNADPLSNTTGSVLDPIVALRQSVTVPANETAVVIFLVGAAESRDAALALVTKYQSARMADRAFELAWTHNQVTLRQLGATETEAQLYGRLASALIYADPARRAASAVLRTNRRGQRGLWSYGISGDAPLVVVSISDGTKIELVRQLMLAHAYWRMKGLTAELVILNEDSSVYRQPLQDQITSMISTGFEAQLLDKPGGIFVRRLDQIALEDRVLLQSAARIVLDDDKGTLAQQLEHRRVLDPVIPALPPSPLAPPEIAKPLPSRNLSFPNGLGGFTRDGHEYVITLQHGQKTPAPWVNVIANPTFGTVVSEYGSAYTWVENSHEFRLTPWSNDPVQDPTGEALYIRDEQTGQFWSPTPGPARGATPYVIRHGFGYTVFEHLENGLASELWVYVAMDAPVKLTVLKLRNVSGRARRVSVTGYWEWVLGELRQNSLLHVQTEVDLKTGALFARNFYNSDFPERIAFIDVTDATRMLTGDRREFIGRNGSLAQPAAMKRTRLSGKTGAGLDPCGALQVAFDLADGQERETSFRLGVGRDPDDVQTLLQRFRRTDASRVALEGVWSYWNRTLGAVNLDTPDPAVNILANGWLLYQTLSCRLWGRTGFYQSGGAYGFRDQLQDVMALVHAEPALTREHLLRVAAHQFTEGDAQHWWHPPSGRGVRTHISDDFLWLPFATCRYVESVADTGVLDEHIFFLTGRELKPEEESWYDLPVRSEESATLYQHCVRAIERGLRFGEHGLPLMGCGDWNDGMNRVGNEGRGESVWLGFFLYEVLTGFAGLASSRQDHAFADRCRAQAETLRGNLEQHAWDGAWYLRAWFDNGEPLGSHLNPVCQIDSLPQSWSVISRAGDPERSRQAMESVEERLVRRDAGLIQLFDPPFDRSPADPGYIKGYIPGVRENGGQYTHGAIWTVMAFALRGETERAWELFSLLNPINHGSTAEKIGVYKVEPYVVAADVYSLAPHTGRGGWTWYTGSAGWMYRLLVETLLGVNRVGDGLRLEPRLPKAWSTYKIHYRYRRTVYHLTISRRLARDPDRDVLWLDGREVAGNIVPLCDDQQEHFGEFKIR